MRRESNYWTIFAIQYDYVNMQSFIEATSKANVGARHTWLFYVKYAVAKEQI